MSIPFGPIGAVYGDLYARGLGAALRAYRLYDLDYALQQDPEAYERMRRDPVVDFALHYRKLLAAGDSFFLEVKPLDSKGRLLVKIFEALLKQIERFPSVRYNLAEAAVKGSAWAKIWPETRLMDVAGTGLRPWTVAARVQDVDKRRLRQFPVDLLDAQRSVTIEGTALVPAATYDLLDRRREWIWQIYRPLQQRWEEIDRNQYVRHVYQDREDALGYGSGLAGTLYTFWWAKEQVLAHGLQFVERWAQGLVKVGLSTLRDGLASTPSAKQRQTDWLNTFETFRTRHILVHDKDDELEVIPPPTEGWQVIKDALAYFDGAIRVAVLGASLPTEQEVDGGSFAMAKVQESSTDAVVRFDRVLLEETLTRDVIGYLWDANYAALESLGLTDRDPPVLKLRDHQTHDPSERIETALKLLQAGCDLKREELYSMTGFTPPAPEDDVVKATPEPVSVSGLKLPKDGSTLGTQGLEQGQGQEDDEESEPVGEGGSSVADERAPEEPAAAFRARRTRHRLEQPVEPQAITFSPRIELPQFPAPKVDVHFDAPRPAPAPNVDVHFAAPPQAPPAPAPIVKIMQPINVQAAKAPDVIVEGTTVHAHVAAPEVKVETPIEVDVQIKGGEKRIEIKRDGYGRVEGADVKPKE